MTKTVRKAKVGKRPGTDRAATGREPATTLRLTSELRKSIDTWAGIQRDKPTRIEAIRRLIVAGLKSERSRRPIGEEAAAKASRMAADTLDKLGDQTVTLDERDSRKRRLLKGPKEFR